VWGGAFPLACPTGLGAWAGIAVLLAKFLVRNAAFPTRKPAFGIIKVDFLATDMAAGIGSIGVLINIEGLSPHPPQALWPLRAARAGPPGLTPQALVKSQG